MSTVDVASSTPATPEAEATWLAFLSGMAQQRQQHDLQSQQQQQQHPLSQASSVHTTPAPPLTTQSAASAAYPGPSAPPSASSDAYAYKPPPIAGPQQPVHDAHDAGAGTHAVHSADDVLHRFQDLFHSGVTGGAPSSSSSHRTSALPSPRLPSSSITPAHTSPHSSTGRLHHGPAFPPPAAQEDSTLSSLFSSFFPPPEPSHFSAPPIGRPTPLAHQAPPPTIGGDRRPSQGSSYSFSPTSFSSLHLPHLPELLPHFSDPHAVHLPPLRDPLVPPTLASPLLARPDPLAPPPSAFPARAPPPLAPSRQESINTPASARSPVTPLVSLSTGGGSTPSDHDSPATAAATRGKKRAAPAPAKPVAARARLSSTSVGAAGAEDGRPTTATGDADSPSAVANRTAVEDDKRRRNTEASARFRAKKKNHTVNLTRTVSDLTSRVSELEVEAGDLRRENTWLKEIVVARARGKVADENASGGKGGTAGQNGDG